MDIRINYHYRRRSPALLRAAVEGRQSSVNTYGGVETYSPTNSLSKIVIDSAIPSYTGTPTTQTPLVTATPTSQTTSSSLQVSTNSLTSSSVTSPSSSVVPVQSTPSASWVSSHKLILAGAIAAFIALTLAIVFVVTVGCRRMRQKRLQEEISRKSFAAGQNSVIEQPRTEKGSMMLFGSKGHTWRGLGSKEDIADFRGGDPVPIVLSEYASPKGDKHSRRQSLPPGLPQQEHEPFHLTGAFGPSPTNDEDDGLTRPTTPSHTFATSRTLTPHKGGAPELHPHASFQSVYSSSIYTDRSGPEILPPSPPLPVAEIGKAAKVARTNNIKALDSLIAALDHANDAKGSAATGLPPPSVWRAALGGSPASSPRPSNRHAEHDTHPQISSSRMVR